MSTAIATQPTTVSLYGGEFVVEFSETAHRYKVNGDYKPGVTTALGCLSKDQLVQWSANQAVDSFRAARNRDKGVFDVVVWTAAEFEKVCAEARYAYRTLKDDAAEVGKRVHEWISNHIKGTDGPFDDAMTLSINAFLRWEDEHQPEYLDSERIVYSKKYDYCGTVDLVMNLNGKRVIADLKTGKPDQEWRGATKTRQAGYTGRYRARESHLLQNAAYDQAIGEEDGIFADAVGVIYLPDELYFFQSDETDFWRRGWVSVLETYRFMQSAGKVNAYEENN